MLTKEQVKRGIGLLAEASIIPTINRGGCLYASWAVCQVLRRENVESEDLVIVQLEYGFDRSTIEKNREFLSGNSEVASSSSHFGVSFDGGNTFYDSNGKIPDNKYAYKLIIPKASIDKFCENALRFGGWNPTFCRMTDLEVLNFIFSTNLKSYR